MSAGMGGNLLPWRREARDFARVRNERLSASGLRRSPTH
jgi:hypothetical protein